MPPRRNPRANSQNPPEGQQNPPIAVVVAVPTVAAVIVPAIELRRQFVGLESGRVELAQGQSGQH